MLCAPGSYCDGAGAGACQPTLGLGSPCARGAMCSSANCLSGICQ
jgi:hypothetical protein